MKKPLIWGAFLIRAMKGLENSYVKNLTLKYPCGRLSSVRWSRGVAVQHAALSRPRSRVQIPSGPQKSLSFREAFFINNRFVFDVKEVRKQTCKVFFVDAQNILLSEVAWLLKSWFLYLFGTEADLLKLSPWIALLSSMRLVFSRFCKGSRVWTVS